MIALVNNKKDARSVSVSVVLMIRYVLFDTIDPSSNPPDTESHIVLQRHLFSIKIKKIIEKLKIKVLGRVRVGVGRDLLSQ